MGKKSHRSLDSLAWQWTEGNGCTIADENLKSSYRLLLPVCSSSCRKNSNANPRCLHGLGEANWGKASSESDRKEFTRKMEEDINAERRTEGELVGLRNLGATCYVNTYLQLWFHNLDFRKAIYALEDHHTTSGDNGLPQTICGQLQLMFGLLQSSSSKSVDPSSFINCLGLPTDLQQDAQEFSKLFMCLLETTPGLSEVIQHQFSGTYAYTTKCLKCSTVVETAAKFYELDLNIQGHKDLKSAISEYLKEEHLEKDNQYFCDSCRSKQDAVRKIVLKDLPPTLSIQLLRFVYDRASQRKHKINTNLSFPETLDFTSFVLPSEYTNNLEYNLSAVLLHRGLSASSGHFVAHILDPTTKNWFQFNDEVVAEIKTGKKLDLDNSVSEDNVWSEINAGPAPKKPKTSKGHHSSKDVYMLVYTKKSEHEIAVPDLPQRVAQCVETENAKFESKLVESLKKAEEEQKEKLLIDTKMEKLINILQSDSEVSHEWLPTTILKNYLHNGKLFNFQPTSLSKYVCMHGNLSLNCLNNVKYVPKEAADIVYSDNDEIVRLSHDLCQHCVYNRCMWLRGKRKLAEDAALVTETLQTFENMSENDSEEGYFVGKLSFRKWKSLALQDLNKKYQPKSSLSSDTNGDLTPEISDSEEFQLNSDLLCVHQNLTIDLTSSLVVPQLVWNILIHYFPQCPTFKVEDSSQCMTCFNDAKKKEERQQLVKAKATEQKSVLHQLYLNKNRPIFPSSTDAHFNDKCAYDKFYVVNSEFVSNWRDFIRFPNKYELMECIENKEFLCKHEKLLYDLPSQLSIPLALKCDFANDAEPQCVLLWENEWQYIEKNFSIDFPICVQKRIIAPCSVVLEVIDDPFVTASRHSTAANLEGGDNASIMPSAKINPSVRNRVGAGGESQTTVNVTISPDLCHECIKGLAIEEKKKLQIYDDAEIYVVKSTKTIIEMVQAASCNNEVQTSSNRNTRSRRCARGEKKLSQISSSFTLKELKLKIMTLFSVPPFDQNLWLNGRFLSDDSATLGSLDILPGCTLTLIEDVPDPSDLPYICENSKSSEPEVGFIGTSLIGHS